ncbi:helix-turn-helix domain-containing protein [Streptomyces sp. NPDC085614]|uniref:helix-turn-helix domain-containing protein n=1 Tax=Streptomyces sp. NPDC085614 TaxID=3365733 RepID=UPI0037CE1314
MNRFPPIVPRRRVSGTERVQLAADLREQYEAGASIRALARSADLSYGCVHKLLTESGVSFRPSTRPQRSP